MLKYSKTGNHGMTFNYAEMLESMKFECVTFFTNKLFDQGMDFGNAFNTALSAYKDELARARGHRAKGGD